jgi:ribosome-binding factor A
MALRDPRVQNITITDVEISSDLSLAKIFYSVYPSSKEDISLAKEGVDACKGYIRSRLGKTLTLHHIPALNFYYDNSLHEGQYLSKLIETANKDIKSI